LTDSGRPDYSRVVPCCCISGEIQNHKLTQLQRYSNLGDLSRLTFDKLNPDGRQINGDKLHNFKEAYEAVKAFTENPEGWLVLVGPTGSGKTHLAAATANYRLSQSKPVFYIGVADLLDHLRFAFKPDSDTDYDELFEQVKNTPFLILDDMMMTVTTHWAKGKMEQLLNHRFNAQLPTVITTHIPVEDFDESLKGHLTDPDLCKIVEIKRKTAVTLENIGGIDLALLKRMTFENFDYKRVNLPPKERENLEYAYRVAMDFAQSPQGWLILLGENGCGKTHLAASIANHVNHAGKPALFIVVTDLLDHLRSAFGPESKISYDNLFERVKKSWLLILDDFGEQSATPWAQEKLYQLINYRYNARLATVITTCFRLEEIESRISSALFSTR
jgi:DNA replication protein DnaC